jgi:hypothetical protein
LLQAEEFLFSGVFLLLLTLSLLVVWITRLADSPLPVAERSKLLLLTTRDVFEDTISPAAVPFEVIL